MCAINTQECDVCGLHKDCVRRICAGHYSTIDICKECLQTMLVDLELFGKKKKNE